MRRAKQIGMGAVLAAAGSVLGQPCGEAAWQETVQPVAPSPRSAWSSMVFDGTRHETVLFGGQGPNRVHLGDTWVYDGEWSARAVQGPAPRWAGAMAFDSGRGVVVLFGGGVYNPAGPFFNDTWEWNGQAWVERTTTGAPSPRFLHNMVYDSGRGVMVLFGGVVWDAQTAGWRTHGDTWEFRGDTGVWTAVAVPPQPQPRGYHAMAYDPLCQRIVLHGGFDFTALAPVEDAWEFDGQAWAPAADWVPPGGVWGHTMVFDAACGRVFSSSGAAVFGFRDCAMQQWATSFPATGPSDRNATGIAYDSARDRIVVFGGFAPGSPPPVLGDTWELGFERCYANCDESTGSPALTVADFGCFLNRFASADHRANCDGSTAAPVLNVTDFSCFLNAFAAGCS